MRSIPQPRIMTAPKRKRRRFSADIKKQVVREALAGKKTIEQIAAGFGISPDSVKDWKKQALEAIEGSFDQTGIASQLRAKDRQIAALEQLLATRQMELEWLSKKAKELGL